MTERTTKDVGGASKPPGRHGLLLHGAALLPLLVGLAVLGRGAAVSQLNQDEFQHVHIAWNTLQGKLIYRDFHEHHGPLTAWLGALVLRMRGASVASMSTFDLFRGLNLAGVAAVFGFVIVLVRRTGGSWLSGALAAGMLATSGLYGWVGVQYRPDTLQNVLVLAALLFLLERRDAFAAVCLGLLPAVHPKSLLAVAFVLSGVALSGTFRWWTATDRRTVLRAEAVRWAWLVGGLVACQALVVGLFAALGGLDAYVRQAWVGNFAAVGRMASSSDVGSSSRLKLLMADLPLVCGLFVVLSAAGAVLWKRRHDPSSEGRVLVFGAALAGLSAGVLPFRAYALLLPLTLAASTLGLASAWRVGRRGPAVVAAALVGGLGLLRVLPSIGDGPDEDRAMHARVLERVVSVTPREEPVFYVWPSRCSAYVFNADPVHAWRNTTRAISDVASPASDDRFDGAFREHVMSGKARYVALEMTYAQMMPPEFRAYLRSNFRYQGCLWQRK